MKLHYRMPLLAVRDLAASIRFYSELFDQEVVLDLGGNVTMSGGFALQRDFAGVTGVPETTVLHQSNNMELYFEVDDFDAFVHRLHHHPEVDLVHPPLQCPWLQRVVRIYDPDWHMIEVGESMADLARRLLREGHTVAQTAALIHHPEAFVEQCRDEQA